MKLVLTGCSESMLPVGNLTSQIAHRYAEYHGYDFEMVDPKEFIGDGHPSWHKLRLVNDRLQRYHSVLWLDADVVITNPFIGIENRTASFGLTVSTDWSVPESNDIAYFSTGCYVITNCVGSFEFLRGAMARKEWQSKIFWDQSAMQEEYRENESIRSFVHIVPRRELNAVPAFPNMKVEEPWQPGDFVAHLTNRSNEERIRIIQMR